MIILVESRATSAGMRLMSLVDCSVLGIWMWMMRLLLLMRVKCSASSACGEINGNNEAAHKHYLGNVTRSSDTVKRRPPTVATTCFCVTAPAFV